MAPRDRRGDNPNGIRTPSTGHWRRGRQGPAASVLARKRVPMSQDDEAAIRALVAEWIKATMAGDAARLSPLMAEDVVFLTVGHPAIQGRGAFLAAFRALPATMQIVPEYEIQEIRIEGRIAWICNQLRIMVTPPGGGARVQSGPVLSVLQKNDEGRWEIVRDANLLTWETA